MICIPFVPGTFAMTIEYVIRTYTDEYINCRLDASIAPDGSMHSLIDTANDKQNHIIRANNILPAIATTTENTVLTVIYPMVDLCAIDLLELIVNNKKDNDKLILMYIDTIECAEINMLFQYHKIAVGRYLHLAQGLGIFCSDNSIFSNWSDMRVWELRQRLSLFYTKRITEWVNVRDYNNTNVLKIKSSDMLTKTADTLKTIIHYCGLTLASSDKLENFSVKWRSKQQYVLDEYQLINNIVDAVINNQQLIWQPLNIIAESIIQQKLRASGCDLNCYMLDEFPTTADSLRALIKNE